MNTRFYCSLGALLVVIVDFGCGELSAQVPGERPPGEVVRRVQPALEEGQRALAAQDAVAVRAAVAKAISVLGPWAGNPETATRYYPPIVSTPFPVGPGLNPREKVGHIVARAIKDRPEIVVDDWIPDDFSDGGLQFDNGLCGRALFSAWELTRDELSLTAARKAGDWAITRPLVSNWNYNAFSVGLLARLAEVTQGEQKEMYLTAAVTKTEAGVLPGQLPGGRWFDAHNACAVYHNFLMRELLELLHVLPADHPLRPTLLDAVNRALNQSAEETLAHGFTGTWTDNFARGLMWIGENKAWRDALNVNLNASGKNGAPTPGFAILAVIEGYLPNE